MSQLRPFKGARLLPHPPALSPLCPGNPAVTAEECVREHTHTHLCPHIHPHPPGTGRQITPRPGFPNIPLHKEALGTFPRCTTARRTKDEVENEKK